MYSAAVNPAGPDPMTTTLRSAIRSQRAFADALAQEFDGRATVAKLDVDENPNVPGRYAVRGIPTLLLFKDGELKETVVGLAGKDDLTRMIDKHLQ